MTQKKWLMAAIFGALALALAWWFKPAAQPANDSAKPQHSPQSAASEQSAEPSEIPLSAQQVQSLGLQFAAATAADMVPIATLPALIAPPPNARVAVAAQLPGIVTRIFVTEGDMVKAGQILASVSSRDLVSLGAELSRARARLSVAEANAKRIKQLSNEGIIAPARADEADAALREAQVNVQENARLMGMTGGASGAGGYALTAPISGRISHLAVETGKAINPDAAPFVIDGAGPLQAVAQLPERLIDSVHAGMRVAIAPDVIGEVMAVNRSLDAETRSATLTARLPAAAALRAGQSLSLAVMGPAPADALSVPATAIIRMGDQHMVFVKSNGGVTPRIVTIADGGRSPSDTRTILSGLKAGEQVAISSVSELKSLSRAD
ncbi:efflux RND transporter periplasmic adaptor subunit [Sphingopyxis yananensis]|uniref:efflux RND transporter periplasmic adaptor subunit n=1 Tax=Sphingopyxis yananensis TaxID=2886687 RepID=UPI001D121E03|nr:efflux RND transporter periplasmic adaptor subunit [Sphingopyxis yananensis]MCC2601959.1 efflux RND transporter periplasmic adaptor subunit [Sphingopyxis yananensis]